MTAQQKQQIFEYLALGEPEQAIVLLQNILTIDDLPYLDVAMLSGRYKRLEKSIRQEVIESDQANYELNEITESLFRIVKRIEVLAQQPDTPTPKTPSNRHRPKNNPPPQASLQGYLQEVKYKGSIMAKRRDMQLRLPYGIAFDKCCDATRRAGMQIERSDKEKGIIEAKVKGHLLTAPLGEKILFYLTGYPGNDTRLVLISDCALPITLVDYGRNNKNLDRLQAYL